MPTPTEDRIERARRIRPVIKRMVAATSLREVEKMSRVNRTTLHDFLTKGAIPQDGNLEKLEELAASRGMDFPEAVTSSPNEGSDLARQIDEVRHGPGSELDKTAAMLDLWGVYRQRMMSDLTTALREDRTILEMRAEALRDAWRTTRLQEEEAARRRKDVSSAQKATRAAKTARQARRSGEAEASEGEKPKADDQIQDPGQD